MRHAPLALAFAATLLASPALAGEKLSQTDETFAKKVGQGGMFEVEAGSLAAQRGSTQVIRDQGNTESHDHNLVNQKLKSILSGSTLTLPNSLNPEFSKELGDLRKLSGTEFDKTYLADMKTIHDKDGAAFAAEAQNGDNPKLKAFAAQTHAIVEAHIGELNGVPAD